MSTSRLLAGLATVGLAVTLTACGGSGKSTVAEGCTPAHQFSTVDKGSLTVSTYDLPPFASTTGDGGLGGVDGDLVKAIAQLECVEVKPQTLTASAAVPAVQNGRIDIAIGDWYRTQARSQVVALSDPLYLDQMGLVTSDGTSDINSLKGKKVGSVDGYLWTSDMQALLGDDFVLYPSGTNLYQDLKAGRIGAAVDSFASAKATLGSSSDLKVAVAQPDQAVAASVQAAQAAFPMPKGNQALVDAVNADLATLRQNGKLVEILTSHGLDASAADVGDARLI